MSGEKEEVTRAPTYILLDCQGVIKKTKIRVPSMTSNVRTPEEARTEHIRVMGEELGSLYDVLWQEVAGLHGKWSEYVALFGTRESRVDLLNQAAPSFFRIVQDSLWEDVLLHIARLTDPPKSAGKSNLTVQLLTSAVDHPETKVAVAGLIAKAQLDAEFCRDWRNRRLAHRDLHLALARSAEPLQPASRKKVDEALQAITGVLNAVANHYLDSTTFFDSEADGVLSLLHVLDSGLNAERAMRERIKSGYFDPTDFK